MMGLRDTCVLLGTAVQRVRHRRCPARRARTAPARALPTAACARLAPRAWPGVCWNPSCARWVISAPLARLCPCPALRALWGKCLVPCPRPAVPPAPLDTTAAPLDPPNLKACVSRASSVRVEPAGQHPSPRLRCPRTDRAQRGTTAPVAPSHLCPAPLAPSATSPAVCLWRAASSAPGGITVRGRVWTPPAEPVMQGSTAPPTLPPPPPTPSSAPRVTFVHGAPRCPCPVRLVSTSPTSARTPASPAALASTARRLWWGTLYPVRHTHSALLPPWCPSRVPTAPSHTHTRGV
ncbi:vegetative cell wall protein gp1-like [Alosa alosa]|uniref:vegetative cell wall protein gp1-like n=1 Tax=Alosa alosa TaxID=278164 RepID=UPI002015456B|nr:vegetative cell wall protein gp1-like [Alosa alosa]